MRTAQCLLLCDAHRNRFDETTPETGPIKMDVTKILHSRGENLLTPIPMCFALGIFCKVIHGGIKIPKDLYYSISILLLMSTRFLGGHELAKEVGVHGTSTVVQ